MAKIPDDDFSVDGVDSVDSSKYSFTPTQLADLNDLIGSHGSVLYSAKVVDELSARLERVEKMFEDLQAVAASTMPKRFLEMLGGDPTVGWNAASEYARVWRAADAYYEATGGTGLAVRKRRTGEYVVDLEDLSFKPYLDSHFGGLSRSLVTVRQYLVERGRTYVSRVPREVSREVGWTTERPYALILKRELR